MPVRIRGRRVNVHVAPIRNGYFLRGNANEVFGIQPGSILEVNGASCIVKYLIAGDPGEPEVWAILLPVIRPESVPSLANKDLRAASEEKWNRLSGLRGR